MARRGRKRKKDEGDEGSISAGKDKEQYRRKGAEIRRRK